MPRLPTTPAEPDGLLYEPDFVTDEEERAVLAGFEDLDFAEVRMHGQTARRTVVHFGLRYSVTFRTLASRGGTVGHLDRRRPPKISSRGCRMPHLGVPYEMWLGLQRLARRRQWPPACGA